MLDQIAKVLSVRLDLNHMEKCTKLIDYYRKKGYEMNLSALIKLLINQRYNKIYGNKGD